MAIGSPVQVPSGFRFGGMSAGIKASGKPDLALIVSDQPTVAAAVLTTNLIHAASIDWCRQILPTDRFQALVVNSGNANACTGQQGTENNRLFGQKVAELVGCQSDQVAVLSTGIIGHQLPMPTIETALPKLFQRITADEAGFVDAAVAITTTDQQAKFASVTFHHADHSYCIAVMAKGAGMIGPNMATMLCAVLTDFPLSPTQAQSCLKLAADQSFNAISVEGHMSTNDAMILVTSQPAGDQAAAVDLEAFQSALNQVTLECAKLIPADGEGARHLIRIEVSGSQSSAAADRIARSIANSALVKTAIFGNDPNWGRIVSAAGYAGVDFQPAEVGLTINGHSLFSAGSPIPFDESMVSQSMSQNPQTDIHLQVGNGPGQAVHWTSDLSVDYVRFNSDYST